jgi:hypothetical protein
VQTKPGSHWCPHEPQLVASCAKSMQLDPHATLPSGQTTGGGPLQSPLEPQVYPLGQSESL